MNSDDLLTAIKGLQVISKNLGSMVDQQNTVTHVVRQLEFALEELRRGAESVRLEQKVRSSIGPPGGKPFDFTRDLDVVAERIINGVRVSIHGETKSGKSNIASALDYEQMEANAFKAIQRGAENGKRVLANIWDLSEFDLSQPKNMAAISSKLALLRDTLLQEGFSEQQVRLALSSFNFTDKLGNAMQAAMNEKGEIIFKEPMEGLFAPKGPVAKEALDASLHSPDFQPAMVALFGPSGKVANAAQEAAGATNLDAAMAGLEQKVESGVESALDQAGSNAQAHAASKLGANLKEGVGAMGNAITSVASMGTQVLALGDAWNKPKKGIGDYLNLMAQFGGTVSAAVGVVDALSKAQAAFNIIAAANPVVLIVLAVVALIAAIVALIVYWDQVKAALRDNPWLAVVAALFGVIGVIVLVIAYWDEIKLAVLIAANFMSIQLQKIGGFFIGLKNVIVMVWDWVVASVYNLGVGILNTFIEFGAGIVNFFIDLLNDFIDIYNDIAYYVPGLDEISKVERVNVEAIKVAAKEVPEIDVGKAFAHQGEIKGGLEDQIAKQEQVVAKAQEDDRARQQKAAQEKAEEERQAAAAAPALPAAAPALPAGFGGPAPAGAALPAGVGGPDQSVHVEGGIHVTINAAALDGGSAKMLTDDMVRQIQERLDSLRSERDRRVGVRTPAAA